MAIHLNLADDVGYSSEKLAFIKDANNIKTFFIPSCESEQRTKEVKSNQVSSDNEAMVKSIVNNGFQHMMVKFDSLITYNDDHSYYIGKSAEINSGTGFSSVDVDRGKAQSRLTPSIVLATIAYQGLKTYYHKNNDLPQKPITVVVDMVTSLPAKEYTRDDGGYAQKYTKSTHQVHIMNFDKDVTINIKFHNVLVDSEGRVGDFGINDSIINDFKKQIKQYYPGIIKADKDILKLKHLTKSELAKAVDNKITQDLKDTKDTLNIDIGQITTDCVAIQDGIISPNNSNSFNLGCETYLDLASNDLGWGDNNKKALETIRRFKKQKEAFLNNKGEIKPNIYHDYKALQTAINNNMDKFIRTLVNHDIMKIYNEDGPTFDKLIVFGGGSIALSEHPEFRKALMDGINNSSVPVLFVNKKYAQSLNLRGLIKFVLYMIKAGRFE